MFAESKIILKWFGENLDNEQNRVISNMKDRERKRERERERGRRKGITFCKHTDRKSVV